MIAVINDFWEVNLKVLHQIVMLVVIMFPVCPIKLGPVRLSCNLRLVVGDARGTISSCGRY